MSRAFYVDSRLFRPDAALFLHAARFSRGAYRAGAKGAFKTKNGWTIVHPFFISYAAPLQSAFRLREHLKALLEVFDEGARLFRLFPLGGHDRLGRLRHERLVFKLL